MENRDHSKIAELSNKNKQLARLYTEHQKLEDKLRSFSTKKYLSAVDEQQLKKLKIKKLKGVDEMMKIVQRFEKAA